MDKQRIKALEDAARAAKEQIFIHDNYYDNCPSCIYENLVKDPDTILSLCQEIWVLRQALEIAVADANGVRLPILSGGDYCTQAERELEEKHSKV